MSASTAIINIIFILLSTLLVYRPVRRIINYTAVSISSYIIALIYVFNCMPILLDLVLGIPKYKIWYSAFQDNAADFTCCLIYNTYVLFVMLILWQYESNKTQKLAMVETPKILVLNSWRSPIVDAIIIILPVAYAIAVSGIDAFIGYTTLSRRDIDAEAVQLINQLILMSIFFLVTRYFSKKRTLKWKLFLVGYLFLLIWLNGKRYIIVTILEILVFIYQMKNRNEEKRLKLKWLLPAVCLVTLAFSAYYITNIKVISTAETLYGDLRIDFGRDDVTKFAIKEVLIRGEQIVEYPGETFLSAIFMVVPRAIWPFKPYPHYRYLTAAILGTTIFNIPAGMTPSLFEMSICNFGWFGILLTPVVMILLCSLGDKGKSLETKVLYLLLASYILTQSSDASLSLLLILVISIILKKARIVSGLGKGRECG